MNELSKYNRLLDEGFSLITIGESKIPNIKWAKHQKTAISKEDFEKAYNIKSTKDVGIVTGFNDLEVVDVDLKVLSTTKEKNDFWNEYLNFLKDNIYDFDEKFVIYKTRSAGFHILYKTKKVLGNQKLAKLKGQKEAILETRGVGGYVIYYNNKNVTQKTYNDIQYITDEDWEILMHISKSYDFKSDEDIPQPKQENNTVSLKTWDDYNNRTSILDLISQDFDVVRTLSDKYVIKRKGADSPHSGYVYKQSGCMYLFSTGTVFDAEKLYSPFTAYALYNHNNDLSAAAKDLYQKGYGERIKPKNIIKDEPILIPKEDLVFPIDIFPDVIQKYISLCSQTLNNSVDYMGCSMLFVGSIIIGNSIVVEVKKGWKETANLWLALVGKAGVGKTPSINSITFPIEKLNNREIKGYIKNWEKYEHFMGLDAKDKKYAEQVKKPRKSQFIVNDITLEALVELHYENKNGIGVNKDELAGWFKDMNKYRQGSDLEHWLSSWSGKQINMNRKTAKSAFVQRAFIPVLGGIQPSIMDGFYTEENKSSGFIDRMLFSYPELKPMKYSENEMRQDYLDWYSDYVISWYENIKKIIIYDEDDEIKPHTAVFTEDAKKEWIRIHDDIIELQNSDEENEYTKSMLPKQLSYIPRFALIINTIASAEDTSIDMAIIEKDSILKAEKLSKYFIANAKKIKANSIERNDIKTNLEKNKSRSKYDQFVYAYEQNKDINKSEIASMLGVSRTMIYRYIKEYES